jgi:hypothetical protein
MPRPKRQRVAPTDDWQQLRLLLEWPEQVLYELIRPVVLFGRSAGERAKETGAAARTLHRKADRFELRGVRCQADVRELPISALDDVSNGPDGWRVKFDPELGENWNEL